MRLVFAAVVSTLMLLPYVKIAGGVALLWIAVKLLMPSEEADGARPSDSLWRAVKLIAIADVVMSLDNVIAVAAVADGNFALLVFGLGISIPLIVGGANIMMATINHFPLIIWAGAALLGLDRRRRHRQRPGGDKFRGIVRPRRARARSSSPARSPAWSERSAPALSAARPLCARPSSTL